MTESINELIDRKEIQNGMDMIKRRLAWWSKTRVSHLRMVENLIAWYYSKKITRIVKKACK